MVGAKLRALVSREAHYYGKIDARELISTTKAHGIIPQWLVLMSCLLMCMVLFIENPNIHLELLVANYKPLHVASHKHSSTSTFKLPTMSHSQEHAHIIGQDVETYHPKSAGAIPTLLGIGP